MNREEKRKSRKKYKKQMLKNGLSKDDRELFSKLLSLSYQDDDKLDEGIKVKIKNENFKKRSGNPIFQEWLKENKDKIFTVEYDDIYKDKKILCCLKEDITQPKWLFWSRDLEVIENIEEI